MEKRDVIIVGGGPAGSSAARKLKQAGKDVLVLDKRSFPRIKLCAGWVTPRVWKMLETPPPQYPHSVIRLKRLIYHIHGRRVPLPTRQYAIRRVEFDHWLLQRSGADFQQHEVRKIRREEGWYIIDEKFRCKYLIGAGGTNCPVYRTFFAESNPRRPENRIVTIEEEFAYHYRDKQCYLWFFDNDLPGYSWYVPKGNGYLNIGIGGKFTELQKKGETIRRHWDLFLQKLNKLGLVDRTDFRARGYGYYLRQPLPRPQIGNAFIAGDAAGLATIDMGEGIGPAIHSGILAAEAIISGQSYSLKKVPAYSLWDLLFWWK